MKERPILMSSPNICPILEGRKTHTRRIVKPQPPVDQTFANCLFKPTALFQWSDEPQPVGSRECVRWPADGGIRCPYGQPGDRLWVKETFATLGTKDRGPVVYRADIADGERVRVDAPWRPSIFMPRKFSRILLEITNIRVERLQDISEDDCLDEGIEQRWTCINPGAGSYAHDNDVIDDYCKLWESINGVGSWYANPWVWVVAFKRIE